MFVVRDWTRNPSYTMVSNDVKDVRDIVIGITGDETIVDHVTSDSSVKTRAFYDGDGWKVKEIHTTDHGNPKHHSYGRHGEHVHYYEWDHETGKQISNKQEEIPPDLRKENDDIL